MGFFELEFSVAVNLLWCGCGFQCSGGGFAVDFFGFVVGFGMGFFWLVSWLWQGLC